MIHFWMSSQFVDQCEFPRWKGSWFSMMPHSMHSCGLVLNWDLANPKNTRIKPESPTTSRQEST